MTPPASSMLSSPRPSSSPTSPAVSALPAARERAGFTASWGASPMRRDDSRTSRTCSPSPLTWRERRSASSPTRRPGPSSPTSRSSGRSSRSTFALAIASGVARRSHDQADDRRPADRKPRGIDGHPGGGEARDIHPALLLPPGTLHRGQLPHLSGRRREESQAPDRLQHARGRRNGGPYQERKGRGRPPGSSGIPSREPSARLPGMRPVGRMRPPELLHELRALRSAVPGAEGQEEEGRGPRPARDAGPGALHPVLALREVLGRDLEDG